MSTHRKRTRKPTPRLPRSTFRGLLADGDDLGQAAEVIADEARRLASWSRQIPADITVEVSGTKAIIYAEVGPAYPGETRARHPLFGDREFWYGPPGKPFLAPAADAKASGAMDRYAKKYDRLLAKAGFRPQ